MQELLNSMVRLSAALTVFGMQQVQSAVGAVDTKESMDKLREVLDAMATAISEKIDETKRPTLDSISSLGHDVIGRTVGRTLETMETMKMPSMQVPSIDAHEIMKSTTGMVKTTSDWLDGLVKAAVPMASKPAAAEPKAAEEALAAA